MYKCESIFYYGAINETNNIRLNKKLLIDRPE